jgi:hypothetical protein
MKVSADGHRRRFSIVLGLVMGGGAILSGLVLAAVGVFVIELA